MKLGYGVSGLWEPTGQEKEENKRDYQSLTQITDSEFHQTYKRSVIILHSVKYCQPFCPRNRGTGT